MSYESDSKLIQGLRKNDNEAWAAFRARYHDEIVCKARANLRLRRPNWVPVNQDTVTDIFGNLVVTFQKSLSEGQFDEERAAGREDGLFYYLKGISDNLIRGIERERRKHREVRLNDLDPDDPSLSKELIADPGGEEPLGLGLQEIAEMAIQSMVSAAMREVERISDSKSIQMYQEVLRLGTECGRKTQKEISAAFKLKESDAQRKIDAVRTRLRVKLAELMDYDLSSGDFERLRQWGLPIPDTDCPRGSTEKNNRGKNARFDEVVRLYY